MTFLELQGQFSHVVEKMQQRTDRLAKEKGQQQWILDLYEDLNILIEYFNRSQQQIHALEAQARPATYINAQLRDENQQLKQILQAAGLDVGLIPYFEKDLKEIKRENSKTAAQQKWPELY